MIIQTEVPQVPIPVPRATADVTSPVMNDWSEARVDPLAALLIQGGGQTGKYQAVVSRAT